MAGMLAIVASLALLMFFAYRGVTVLLLTPGMAALAVLLSGDAALLLPTYTGTFMPALANYAMAFSPIFLLGALFGQFIATRARPIRSQARSCAWSASAMPGVALRT